MSIEKQAILEIIYSAIDEVNKYAEDEDRLNKTIDQPLFTKNGPLDSMGLVNLVITLEELIETEFGKSVQFMQMDFLNSEKNPMKSVEALADYLCEVL